MKLDIFLDRFTPLRKVGKNYTARCPAHDDRSANTLHIAVTGDGRRLVICRAGCTINDVLGAAKLKASDLFDDVAGAQPGRPRRPRAPVLPDDDAGWTPAQIAAAQRAALVDVALGARLRRRPWDMIRLADPIKRGWRIIDDARRQAAQLGPDEPSAMEMIAYAQQLERYVLRLEAEQDARARELRQA